MITNYTPAKKINGKKCSKLLHPLSYLKISLCFLIISISSAASAQEPRLVLPIGHTEMIASAVFSPDGKLALTASYDKTARIYDVASGKELQVYSGHTGRVTSAVFSSDGKLAITASYDSTARIYNVESGKVMHVLQGHTSWVNSAVFSPDGELALTASFDLTARIFEVASGKELRVLEGQTGRISYAVFSPNGKLALTSGYDAVRIFEVESGKELQVFFGETGASKSAVFSPDGKLVLIAGNDNKGRIYDITSGKELHTLSGHAKEINSISFSLDGKLIVTASGDGTSRIYEVENGRELQVLNGNTNGINSAVFSSDSKQVLMAIDDATSRIYDIATGKELQILRGHKGYVNSAVYSPNGKLVLTASEDATARIYEVFSGKEVRILIGHGKSISSAIFSPDQKHVLTVNTDDYTAHTYELTTSKNLQILNGHSEWVNSAVFSPDGRLVITTSWDATARVYEVESGKEMHVLQGNTSAIYSGVFSSDTKLALTASGDGTARIYDMASGNLLQVLTGHTDEIRSAVFSPDDRLVITASDDGTARIYDSKSGKELQILTSHTGYIATAVFSPDGKLALTAGKDGTARIYNVLNGIEKQLLIGHTNGIKSAVFSPDGKLVLTASFDGTSRCFDVDNGEELYVFSGNQNAGRAAIFSPDGKSVLTTSFDGTVTTYDIDSGKEQQVFKGHTDWIKSAVFSLDGKLILTVGEDFKSILWDVTTGKSKYTRLQLDNNNWLVYDEEYRFDGTPGAIDYLYLVCGLEVVDLEQVKDSLYVPGLASKIMNKVPLMRDGKRIPKLSDLNICNLTPIIEREDEINRGEFHYRITPRNGGLGVTEVYINGNLTFIFKKEELKQVKTKDQILSYELMLTQEQLSPFLVSGDSLSFNPIVVKSKIEKGSIYSRGQKTKCVSSTSNELPRFYGVFIGVDEYGNSEKKRGDGRYINLDFAGKDADDLANAIEGTTGKLFNERSIYRLTSKAHQLPTKEEIHATLDSIGKVARANDVLFIFFAGHGDVKKTEEGKSEMRFLTERASIDNKLGFSIADLMEWCRPQNIKAQKRVFVFDACHSGQAVKDFTDLAFAGSTGRGEDEDTRILQLTKLKDKNGMMILAASAVNESAYEDPTLQQGVLTYHMLNSIKNEVVKLSPAKDSLLNIRNWFDEVIDEVTLYSLQNDNDQTPISFGDGLFYIGKITPEVQQSIIVSEQKMRLGKSVFVPVGEAISWCPDLEKQINDKVAHSSGRGIYVYTDREGYFAKGSYQVKKKKIMISYLLYHGEEIVGQPILLPSFKVTDDPQWVAEAVKMSIQKQLEQIVISKNINK